MKSTQPYQPLLLRVLHGLTGLCLLAAVLTAFWTYDTYDGRWGRIPLPEYSAIEGLHGTFGLYTLLIFPVLVIYAVRKGQRRLIQPDSFAKLAQMDKPIGWYSLNRIANTLSIFAVTFALFSGKMMDETWLPKGELYHQWYYAHLISWIVVVVCIALHVLINARVGGTALLLSMFNWRFRKQDHPSLWYPQTTTWLANFPRNKQVLWQYSNSGLMALEVFVLVSLIAAWIIPLLEYVPSFL